MSEGRARKAVRIPPWEWAFGFAGFAFVAVTVVFLTYKVVAGDHSPPDIAVRAEAVVAVQGGYLVTISAVNTGDRTAANVKVQGELRSESGTEETSEMTFQYLPARSRRQGGLFFARDPRRLKLDVSARGYEEP